MSQELLDISYLIENFLNFLPQLISAATILIITLFGSSLIRRTINNALLRKKAQPQISQLLARVSYWTTMIIGIITALQQVGFNLTAFLTGIGIVGFTVGFALQDVSKNFVSGILLLIYEPFKINDLIEVSNYTGQVVSIDLRATELKLLDGKIALIPNSELFTKPITNYTKALGRRIEIQVGVAYESDLVQVRKTTLEVIKQIHGIVLEPTPNVYVNNFGNSTIDISIYFWINPELTNIFAAKDEALELINNAFNQEQIRMPFPTQRLLLDQVQL